MQKNWKWVERVLFALFLLVSLLWMAVKLKESIQNPTENTIQDFSQQLSPSHPSVTQHLHRPVLETAPEPIQNGERSAPEKEFLSEAKRFPGGSTSPIFDTKKTSNRAPSSIRDAVNSFLQKFLKLDAMAWILSESGLKGDAERENLTPPLLRWIGTKQFGFEFESIPSASDWKVTEQSRGVRFSAKELSLPMKTFGRTENGSIFLKAENNWAGAELFFAAIAKDPFSSYSQQLSDHWVAAENLAGKIGLQLSLKNLKLFQQETKFLPHPKFLQIKISGLHEKRNIRFKGKLFFFQTPSHFVGAMLLPSRLPQNFNFARVERLLAEMFQKMVFTSSAARFARPARSEPVPNGSENILEPAESSRGRYGRPPPLVTSKRAGGAASLSKIRKEEKKAWEKSSENPPLPSEDLDSDLSVKTPGFETHFVLCPVCSGKSRCSNPNCDGGFILCELCKADPPPKCRKCRGTGLKRVDDPFTRIETWGYCERCYGTGKKICRNDCRGGKLKCSICQGTGLCPECKGRGFASR